MKKGALLSLLFIVVLSSLVFAQQITLEFESSQKKSVENHYMTLHIDGKVYKEFLEHSSFVVEMTEGEHTIDVALNSFQTPTPDYFGSEVITASSKETITVHPIGYLQGSVVDAEGNLLPGTALKFTCFSPHSISFPKQTDSAGFFTIPNIPVGDCSVIASTEKAAGSVEFTITQGQLTKTQVQLERGVVTGPQYFSVIVSLLAVILLIVAVYFLAAKRRTTPKSRKIDNQGDSTTLSSRADAILQTLSEKEKKVIHFLLESGNTASQARIRHATKIPRTSLARVLKKLESKKVVEVEKEGKMVSISISDFFLGK